MYTNITFPTNLEKDYSSYIMLKGQQWGTKYKDNKTADYQSLNNEILISLPMPTNGLTDSTSHNWESTEKALLNISKGNLGQIAMKGAVDKAKDAFGSMAAAQQFKTGQTINDFASLTYGGQDFRTFDFEFDLVATNSSDATKLNNLIDAFKYGSLPDQAGTMINYPFFWTIKALKPDGKKYFDVDKCVITNLTINKFPDGNPTIHADGEPVKQNISISFSELYREWRADYS